MPSGGYQSPDFRTIGLPVFGRVVNPACRRPERTPPFCAPSSTITACDWVWYGIFFSTFGTPITSALPSPSRSPMDGGDAVHCSQDVFFGLGQVPVCACHWASSTAGDCQRMNWPQPSRCPA